MKNSLLLGVCVGAAATAALCIGASKIAAQLLISGALDREEPKFMELAKDRLSGTPNISKAIRQAYQQAEAFRQQPHTVVEIKAYDGITLQGHLYKAPNEKRILIAMHGWRSNWSVDFGLSAPFLLENGCSVLFAEQRAQGSDGEYIGFGLLERYDCLEWAKWVDANRENNVPVYLLGVSMGASTVLMTTGFPDLPASVHGVIADCGFTGLKEIWQHVTENNIGLPYPLFEKEVNALCEQRIGMRADAYSTLDAMQVNTRPILFVHGKDDHFVPVEMTLQNYEACHAPKELLLVENADHAQSYGVETDAYQQKLLQFFESYDHFNA